VIRVPSKDLLVELSPPYLIGGYILLYFSVLPVALKLACQDQKRALIMTIYIFLQASAPHTGFRHLIDQ
jgi:hypothetical protein